MPKKPSGNFDQKAYMAEWKARNMKQVKAAYKAEFVEAFKEACFKAWHHTIGRNPAGYAGHHRKRCSAMNSF